MSDLRPTIVPKSDQLNADDLIGRTLTIKITNVSVKMDEQPVSIHFEGDGGKPYKPGKSMRRVLVNVWGPDGNQYIGRTLTLYRDEKVQFGGLAVGGIRISHMSDIPKEITMALTVTRANKRAFTVRPLAVETAVKPRPVQAAAPERPAAEPADDPDDVKLAEDIIGFFQATTDAKEHLDLVDSNGRQFAWLKQNAPRLWREKVDPAIKANWDRHQAATGAQEAAE